MPPARLRTLPKPAPRRISSAFIERRPVVALGDDLGVAVELAQAIGELAQRNEPRAVDVGDLPLVRLAHVHQHQLVALGLRAPAGTPRR